uniref:Vacuolar protein-sorting-associated protein 25 n=1 Tax=Leptobrachium leishanense TaxID=445787 RepID=A0A8C5MQ69_9ANUR
MEPRILYMLTYTLILFNWASCSATIPEDVTVSPNSSDFTNVSSSQTPYSPQSYVDIAKACWSRYTLMMDNVEHENLCEWHKVNRLQPNVDTRQKQLSAWSSLVLSYSRHNKLYTLSVMEIQESPLFNNKKIQRKLPLESVQVVLEELRKKGNLEWLDKTKARFLIMWRRPDEWGKVIYQWVSKNGMTNSVFTLYELISGDDTAGEEFHGLEEAMLLRSLEALQTEHKAEIITLNDSRGVKFF